MDIKYAYYNTSKGYRVVGGTAAHFLKADGSLDNTSYIPVNTEINMGDKNLNFTSGSLSKVENGSRVFNKVFQNYTQSAQTGILSIKFPQASTAATMFDVTIKIFNYQATYLGSVRVAFYKQTATVIHSTGRKCLIECTDNFPSTIVNVGMDLSGNVCINLGDINTVWNLHTSIEVERVLTTYTGYNVDWSKGWSQTVETVAPVVPTTYQSLVSIPTEIGATRSLAVQNLSTNLTTAGTIDISGGASASLTTLTLASKADGSARSMRHELQSYYTSAGSVNYPSQIGAGIKLERYSSASDQRGFNIWSAGLSGQIYFKTFNGTSNDSSWELFASREWANGQFSLLNHTHTFDSLTSKPTTLSGYGITDAMSTSHPANGITSTNISNWNASFGWGDYRNFGLGSTAVTNVLTDFNEFNTELGLNSRLFSTSAATALNGPTGQQYPSGILITRSTAVQSMLVFGGHGNTNTLAYRNKTGTNTWGDWIYAWTTKHFSQTDLDKFKTAFPTNFANTINSTVFTGDLLAMPVGTYSATVGSTATNVPFSASIAGGLISVGQSTVSTRILGARDNSDNLWFQSGSGTGSWRQLASREWSTANLALVNHTHTFASLTSKPTTLAGYGITDGMSTSHPANGITTTLINNWNNAYNWGNHKAINDNQWLGSDYVSGGLEKPNSSYFGAGKLKLQMLSGGTNNLPSGTDTWNDVLWMSSYTGGDVKKSTAIISSKQSNKIGFSKQDYDSATWGNYIEFWTTANLDPNDFATLSMLNGFVSKTGDTMTGTLSINSAGQVFVVRGTDQTSNYMSWLKYDGSKAIAYIGADGGAAIGNGGTGDNFAITSAGGGDLILSSSSGNIQVLGQFLTNNHGNSAQWISAYNNSLMNRGLAFSSNIDANAISQGTEIIALELPNGTGNTNFPFNSYGTLMRFKSNTFTSDFAHEHNGRLFIRNWYNPAGASSVSWREVWDNVNLPNPVTLSDLNGYATQTWVNTNFIPKSHPVYNITQANINSWNAAAGGSLHTHSNLFYLDNIDQYLGTGQAPQFGSIRLMDSLGYGLLALEEGFIGGEIGLVDISNKRFYAGRINEYLKYGSSIDGFEGLNIHFDAQLLGIGREIGNDEDKVQIAGNISVDTVNISDVPTELVLNPLYNTDGDVRRSRNAHIYIVTGKSVRLPDQPILGQRIEIFNDSDSEIEVAHGNVGTMFYVPRFCKVTGIVGARGFIFDEKPVPAKKYDV